MDQPVSIELLADHRELLSLLQQWFEAEWPSCYGPNGPGDAREGLRAFANRGSLPIGVVALRYGVACGVAALKRESIASRRHLSPWAAAGLVLPVERRKGIGSLLLAALEGEAHKLGVPFIYCYCATGTAHTLLRRRAWEFMEWVVHGGESLGIYRKACSAWHPKDNPPSLAGAEFSVVESERSAVLASSPIRSPRAATGDRDETASRFPTLPIIRPTSHWVRRTPVPTRPLRNPDVPPVVAGIPHLTPP